MEDLDTFAKAQDVRKWRFSNACCKHMVGNCRSFEHALPDSSWCDEQPKLLIDKVLDMFFRLVRHWKPLILTCRPANGICSGSSITLQKLDLSKAVEVPESHGKKLLPFYFQLCRFQYCLCYSSHPRSKSQCLYGHPLINPARHLMVSILQLVPIHQVSTVRNEIHSKRHMALSRPQ